MLPALNMQSTFWLCALLVFVQHVFAQHFAAAPKHSSLKRSDVGFQPCHETRKLVYYSDNGRTEMATSITLFPKFPIFVNEDMDHEITRCVCSSGYMQVEFSSELVVMDAALEWSNAGEFVFITSSPYCGNAGEHTPYLVRLVYTDPSQRRVILEAQETHLRDVTTSIDYDMGQHVIPQVDQRVLRRAKRGFSSLLSDATAAASSVRSSASADVSSVESHASSIASSLSTAATAQASNIKSDVSSAASSIKSVATSVASNIVSKASSIESVVSSKAASAISKVSTMVEGNVPAGTNTGFPPFTFSATTASSSAAPTQSGLSVHMNYVNTALIPPDNQIAAEIVASEVSHVNLECLNCTMYGSFSLKAAGFSTSGDDMDQVKSFLHNGSIEFDANNVAANISLQLGLQQGLSVNLFNGALPRKSLGSISIAGLLSLNPVMDFNIPIWLTLDTPVVLQAGFVVPPISAGILNYNFDSPTRSYAKGFDSRPKLLPFNANAPDLTFNISVAFRPQLSINAGFVVGKTTSLSVYGGVGFYVDLPKFSAQISAMQNVDNNCAPSSTETDKAIQVLSGYSFDAGAFYNVTAAFDGVRFIKDVAYHNLDSSNHSLPAQCFRWDTQTNSLVATAGDFVGINQITSTVGGDVKGIENIVLSLGAKIGIGVGAGIGGLGLIALIFLGVICCRRPGKNPFAAGGRYRAAPKLDGSKGMEHGTPTEFEMHKTGTNVETAYLGSFHNSEPTRSTQWDEKATYQPLTPPTATQYQFGNVANDGFAMDPYQAQYASDPRYNSTTAVPSSIQPDDHINPAEPLTAVGSYAQPSSPPRIVRKPTAQEKRSLSSMSVPVGVNPAYGQGAPPQNQSQPLLNRYNSEPSFDPSSGYVSPPSSQYTAPSKRATYPATYPENTMSYGGGGWANVKSGDGSRGTYSGPQHPHHGNDYGGGDRHSYTMYQDTVAPSQPAWERPLMSQGYDQGYQGSGLVKFEKIKLGR